MKKIENKESEPLSFFAKNFIKRIQNTAALASLWKKGESFIIGVSGGPDSLCLLDVLYVLSKKYDFKIHIAHINYNLRGKDSIQDEALVRGRANAYGLSLSVLHPKKKMTGNLEETLRKIRYRFFEKIRKGKNASIIAVAHNQDDQAETFLMRLLRGSGTSGLSSMQLKNEFLIRPLLKTSRSDILRYMKERKLSYRLDLSNNDTSLFRNRLRHKLFPLLEKDYQPQVKRIFSDTAELLAADSALLNGLANASFSIKKNEEQLTFSCKELLSDSDTLASYKLRLLLRPFFGSKSAPKGLIDELMKVLKSSKNRHQTVTARRLKFVRKGDTVTLLNLAK